MRTRNSIVAMAFIGLAASAAVAAPATSAPAPVEEHCVIEVTGRTADGRLKTTEPRCYADRGAARQAMGIASVIAVHYDGLGYTGSSITINGADCLGGWLNLTVAWRNRISSSINYCPITRFYDGLNLTGSLQVMFGSGNLGALNNKSESVQYSS